MYSNYLTEVGKLVYIIGEQDITSQFKKLLDSNVADPNKSKYFFKCVDELPVNSYKKNKIQIRRKGILRCDWFSKILDRAPMMIFMVFNFTKALEGNEKWQDRLYDTIKKINKVVDVLRSSNKQQIILKVIIIVSKQVVVQSNQTGNVIQKINNYLKNYQKELSIYQSDQLAKEVSKLKSHWFSLLEKSYDRKHRAINKRKQESTGERRLGCIVKMAVISEIMSKKDSFGQYQEAYKSLHSRFVEIMKGKIDFENFDLIRQVRTLADIVLLRKLMVKISIGNDFSLVADSISCHMKYFFQGIQNHHIFFKIENMIWRENFLQNLLQVLHINDHKQIIPRSYFAQLINSSISFSYNLSKSETEINEFIDSLQAKPKEIEVSVQTYIGSRNYPLGVEITDIDILYTELTELVRRKKDYITRGQQTITRYKSMGMFKKNQTTFFNIYLLRFYLVDGKFSAVQGIFREIVKGKIGSNDFYTVNWLIGELQSDLQQSSYQKLVVYGLATLISDYFKNIKQLETYGSQFFNSLSGPVSGGSVNLLQSQQHYLVSKQILDPLIIPLPSESNIFNVSVLIDKHFHDMQDVLQIGILLRINNDFMGIGKRKGYVKINYNLKQVDSEFEIDLENGLEKLVNVKIDPLKYFTKNEELKIKSIVLIVKSNPQIHFLVDNINFSKNESIFLITKLKVPQIKINLPYQVLYIHQIGLFTIDVEQPDESLNVQTKFTVHQDPSNSTQIFVDLNQRMNLVNSKIYHELASKSKNLVYLRSNKIGTRALKFIFEIIISQKVLDKQLKDRYTVVKEINFKTNNLFKTLTLIKESLTGKQVKPVAIPPNKTLILTYSLRSTETIQIIQLNQHKSPRSCFKTLKDLTPVCDYMITPQQKLKNTYIFTVLEEEFKNEQKKQLFLISFYAKWSRIDMGMRLGLDDVEQIVNVYKQEDVKISLQSEKIEIEYESGKTLKKRTKQSLHIKYRNLTNDNIHIYAIMENTDSILRIGNRSSETDLGPKQTKTITFQILPVKSGYCGYPIVRSYIDGAEGKDRGERERGVIYVE